MARYPHEPAGLAKKQRRLETTQWSLIMEAQETLNPGSQEALETLCQTYWFPVYSKRPTATRAASALSC